MSRFAPDFYRFCNTIPSEQYMRLSPVQKNIAFYLDIPLVLCNFANGYVFDKAKINRKNVLYAPDKPTHVHCKQKLFRGF